MNENPRQAELLGQFAQTQDAITHFIATRSDHERHAQGTPEQWAAKETLGLIGFWMEYMVERMQTHARGATPPHHVDFAALNRQAFAAHVQQTWDENVTYVTGALSHLITAVQQSSATHLATLNTYGDGPGDPLWGEVQANGFIWPLQELEKYYRRSGDHELAEATRATLEAVLGKPAPLTCEVITQQEFHALQSAVVIDVRGASEFANGHVPGALHIPLAELSDRLAEIPRDGTVVTYCNMQHPGQSRSEHAATLLLQHGLHAVALQGGFPAWQANSEP